MENIFKSIDELKITIENKTKPIIVLVSGSKDKNNYSWCPDCNKAEDTIQKVKDIHNNNCIIYEFYVERNFWKDKDNIYRKANFLKVSCLPTLVFYKEGYEYFRFKESELFDQTAVLNSIKDALDN